MPIISKSSSIEFEKLLLYVPQYTDGLYKIQPNKISSLNICFL